MFKLCYFLSDDTLEIVPVHTRNDGRDQFPKLLKRSKVPKDIRNPEGPKYTWRDFRIGGIINVYQRAMTIAKADKFTRDFYASKGITLEESEGNPSDEYTSKRDMFDKAKNR